MNKLLVVHLVFCVCRGNGLRNEKKIESKQSLRYFEDKLDWCQSSLSTLFQKYAFIVFYLSIFHRSKAWVFLFCSLALITLDRISSSGHTILFHIILKVEMDWTFLVFIGWLSFLRFRCQNSIFNWSQFSLKRIILESNTSSTFFEAKNTCCIKPEILESPYSLH